MMGYSFRYFSLISLQLFNSFLSSPFHSEVNVMNEEGRMELREEWNDYSPQSTSLISPFAQWAANARSAANWEKWSEAMRERIVWMKGRMTEWKQKLPAASCTQLHSLNKSIHSLHSLLSLFYFIRFGRCRHVWNYFN